MANAKIQEAVNDAIRVESEKREAAAKVIFTKHKSKKISALSKAELDELLTAICQRFGLADETGALK